MGLTEILAQKASAPIKRIGGLQLISHSDACGFLDVCLASSVGVLGIEGFVVRDGRVHAREDAIADFSSLSTVRESVLASKEFLAKSTWTDFYFDFVLVDLS